MIMTVKILMATLCIIGGILILAMILNVFGIYKSNIKIFLNNIKHKISNYFFKSDYIPRYYGYNLFTVLVMYVDATATLILLSFGYKSKILVNHLMSNAVEDEKRTLSERVKLSKTTKAKLSETTED